MDVWLMPQAKVLMLEANRFWFYSLIFSMIGGCVQLSRGSSGMEVVAMKVRGKKIRNEEAKEADKLQAAVIETRRRVKVKLVTDALDIFVPGHITGWIPTTATTVGLATAISTLLSTKDIWDGLQRES